MRNFICAVLLLVFVFVFVGINSFIICRDVNEMIGLIDAGSVEEAICLWEEKRDYIAIFVRDAEIDAVDTVIVNNSDDIAQRLREAVEEVKNGEMLSLQSVF